MELSYSSLFALPLALSLAVILALTFFYGFQGRHRRVSRRIYRCSVCRKVYVAEAGVPAARCPACAEMNEPVRI